MIGIKSIEIHALHLSAIKDKEIKKNGLKVCSVHSTTMNSDFLGKTDVEFKKGYREYYSPLFDCARRLGARILVKGINPEYVPEFNEFRIPVKEKMIEPRGGIQSA